MRAGDPSDIPNPFSLAPRGKRHRRSKPVIAALKYFALVAVGLAVTVAIGSQSRRWLTDRLTSDFETLAPTEKKQRLLQIAELGVPAIDPMVRSLADENLDVARAAHDLLRQAQNEWTVLDRDDLQQRHRVLVEALSSVAVHVPDDRTGWATGLLHQTILETVDQSDKNSRELYKNANAALTLFALSERSGPSVLVDDSVDSRAPRRLSVRAQPLPVAAAETDQAWTDWPPGQESIGGESIEQRSLGQEFSTSQGGDDPASYANEPPSVYRSSSMKLQTVAPGEEVVLRELDEPRETSFQAAELRPVTNLVDSPMETLDDRSVIHWLGSPHLALREKAKSELLRRGYNADQITIATQIATSDSKTRLELVDSIAHSDSIDPRPWLLLLLDDENRDVKLRAISVLATMNDPAVGQALRLRLVDQSDPIVAARLRRVLDLR